MRTASLLMLSGLFVQVAHAADAIRLSTFPNVVLGTWAETAQQCAAKVARRWDEFICIPPEAYSTI